MEAKQDKSASIISQGVEALVERLKQEGVQAGKNEAADILAAAKDKANQILNEAQSNAKALLEEAHQQITKERQAAEDALQLAARNMRLQLRQSLMDSFTQEVKRIVHKELDNDELLRQLILVITADAKEQLNIFNPQKIELQLPEKMMDFDEARKNPELLKSDPLKELVQSLTHQMLRSGMEVAIKPDAKNSTGIKVSLVNEEIVLDLSEAAVSDLLIQHMQPRFRALLEGLLQ